MSSTSNSRGFTLVELMIVLALLSVMALIAIPNFTEFTRRNQVQATAEELKAFITMARTEALTRRAPVTLTFPATGWELRSDGTLLRKFELASAQPKTTALGALNELTYNANGTISLASGGLARFTVCYNEKTETGHMISVLPSGSVRLHQRGKNENNDVLSTCE